MAYHGLPDDIKAEVWERDDYRCRWCGRCGVGVDIHHIEYRRGYQQDHVANLITLCREHHEFVHDSYAIPKSIAQDLLSRLVSPEGLGTTGLALWRESKSGMMRSGTGTVGRLMGTEND